jgi:uncharacterized protein YyaL (SSP411 family)
MRTFLLFFFVLTALSGAEIEWAHSYKEAKERALKEKKNILLLITTERCRWCRKLEATTLHDAEVVGRINAGFVAVHLTRGEDDYPANLKAPMVPMSYFLYPDDRPIMRGIMGYWCAEDYLSIMDDVDRKLKKHRAKQ